MLQFANPWLAALAPLPLLIWLLLPPYRERVESVDVPMFDEMARAVGMAPSRAAVVLRRSWLKWIVAVLAWGLLVIAAMRPELVEPPITRTQSSRDLLIAIDVSQSMETRDLRSPQGRPMSRLDGVKSVVADFIDRRKGDRIGLVLFGASAHLQAPLTLDHDVVKSLLDQAAIGMAGPMTMLGEAIGLGIALLEKGAATSRVLILVTDGNDTGSRMPPSRAAGIAAERGVTIYTIVVGDPKSDDQKVDMAAMADVSTRGHGRAFLAIDRAQLDDVYRTIDGIEPTKVQTQTYRPRRPLFWIPLGAAVALLIGFHTVVAAGTLTRRALGARARVREA